MVLLYSMPVVHGAGSAAGACGNGSPSRKSSHHLLADSAELLMVTGLVV